MGWLKKTKALEKKEQGNLEQLKVQQDKALDETVILKDESKSSARYEHELDFEKIEKLEKKLAQEIRVLKDHVARLDKAASMKVKDFKMLISDIILSLGNVDEHRKTMLALVNDMISRDGELLNFIRTKKFFAKRELHEKDIDEHIREHIYYAGTGYHKGTRRIEMAESEEKHVLQIEALKKQEEHLKSLVKETDLELKLTKIILFHLNNVRHCNKKEDKDIKRVAEIVSKKKILDCVRIPGVDVLQRIKNNIEELVKTCVTEIYVMDTIPGDFINLEEEELLDQGDIAHIQNLEEEADIRHKYII